MEAYEVEARNINCFGAIKGLLRQLTEVWGVGNRPLQLYNRLLEHVLTGNKDAITTHVGIMREFIDNNKAVLIDTQDENFRTQLADSPFSIIRFNDKCWFDFSTFITPKCDGGSSRAIHQHLLIICGLLYPDTVEQIRKKMTALRMMDERQKFVEQVGDISSEEDLVDQFFSILKAQLTGKTNEEMIPALMDIVNMPQARNIITGFQTRSNADMLDFSIIIRGVLKNVAEMNGRDGSEVNFNMASLSGIVGTITTSARSGQLPQFSDADKRTVVGAVSDIKKGVTKKRKKKKRSSQQIKEYKSSEEENLSE